jgi:glyoxylase-like metal-dependent hydrolase (beta-lactamase superfamily II)
MHPIFFAFGLTAVALTALDRPASAQEIQGTADREITLVRDDLYQVRDGREFTVLLVTPDGIILGDPLRPETALWLREELGQRFPARSVRFVIHSHHHAERAGGASVFSGTAERVGHRNFNSALSDSRREAPDLYRFVQYVRSVYDSRRTISLGGMSAELVYAGRAHSPDTTVVLFSRQRIAFAVDPPPVHQVPFSFGSLRPGDVIDWLHTVVMLDFDEMLFGSGERVAHADLVALANYLDALRATVATGYEQGQTLAQIRTDQSLDGYRDLPHYAGRATQMAEVYRALRMLRGELSVAGIANYGSRTSDYCAQFIGCAAGGVVPAGTATAAILFGRGPGIVGEVTFGAQSWSSRTAPSYDEEVALRQVRATVLFRYSPPRPGRFSVAMLGGVSQTVGDARGEYRVRGVLRPVGGRHAIGEKTTRRGVTLGLDLAESFGGLTFVVPLRVTRIQGSLPSYWPGRYDVHAGIGIRMRVFRRLE